MHAITLQVLLVLLWVMQELQFLVVASLEDHYVEWTKNLVKESQQIINKDHKNKT